MTINTMNSFAFRANGGYRGGVQAINKSGWFNVHLCLKNDFSYRRYKSMQLCYRMYHTKKLCYRRYQLSELGVNRNESTLKTQD